MPNVLLQYNGKRFPLALKMPWLAKPLTWDRDTGRLLEVDSEDAERLSGDGDGTIFVIVSHSDTEAVTQHIKDLRKGFPDLEEKSPPDWYKWLKNEGKVPVIEILDSPGVGEEKPLAPSTEMQCPYCDHKPYKRKDFYDKHIADKHPERLIEVNNGNNNR